MATYVALPVSVSLVISIVSALKRRLGDFQREIPTATTSTSAVTIRTGRYFRLCSPSAGDLETEETSASASVGSSEESPLVTGAMNLYPRRGTVSMKVGFCAESPSA